jgi:hypothetical protein
MYGYVLRGHLYGPRLWPCGRCWFSTCACPGFAIVALLEVWSILMIWRHAYIRLKPSSLFKKSGCSRISIASLTRRFMYLVAVPNLEVPSNSMRWYVVNESSATADLSGWFKRTCSLSLVSMVRPVCPT